MRTPNRTRRLSIAAMVSLLLFVVVAGDGIRSLWIQDYWNFGSFRTLSLAGGRIWYDRLSGDLFKGERPLRGHELVFRTYRLSETFSFSVHDWVVPSFGSSYRQFTVAIPLWPFVLLLLIAPVRWLVARSANTPAFPVITTAKQEHA